MESLPPKPSEEPEAPPAPPAPEEAPAAPASSGAPLPEAVPPTPPSETTAAGAEAGADAGTEPAESEPATPARRPRGRTGLIIASAALLGIVAGVATGYTVQADRKPTPLPPLSQAKLTYPDKYVPEDEWEPVPAKHDRRVKTDGDLRKLLVGKPEGAQESAFYRIDDGWMSPSGYAVGFEDPGSMFSGLVGADVRRIAAAGWDDGNRSTLVCLLQFHDLLARDAADYAGMQRMYMPSDAGNAGHTLAGSENGRYWVYDAPHREPGYLPIYSARAIAVRGDIVMDIYLSDTEPISEKDVRELAERQLERL